MSTASPMLAWAAPRIRAACNTAEMITAITTPISAAKIPTVALRVVTSTVWPKMVSVCVSGAKTTPPRNALMNVSGTTTIATIMRSPDAFAL